jgi:hypothetical protein
MNRRSGETSGRAQESVVVAKESAGLTPVWYMKHNFDIRQLLDSLNRREPDLYARMSPFIDLDEDGEQGERPEIG